INDTSIIKNLISQQFPQFISGLISIIGGFVILLIMVWKMTSVMLIAVPLTIGVMMPSGGPMAKISRGLQDKTSAFSGSIQHTVREISLMKASTAEAVEKKRGLAGSATLRSYGLTEARILALVGPVMYFIVMAVIAVILSYGGIRVA